MGKKIIKNSIKILGITIIALYIIFLMLPIFVSPLLSQYSDKISKMAEETSGLKIKINKLGLTTTPKLTVGFKIGELDISYPNNDKIMTADNIQAKISIIPILSGKIEADIFSADKIDAKIKIKPDGNLDIIDYLPDTDNDENKEQFTSLPFGLKLSNRLPDIYIKEYCLKTVDMRDDREYTLQGGNLSVKDFILNKKVKFSTAGIAILDGNKQFSFDIKIKNHIMPQIDINDLLLAQNNTQDTEKKNSEH